MLIVTVDRDGIDNESDAPIRIEDTRTGRVKKVAQADLLGRVRIIYGDERLDGARVWIECDGYA